ncbi:MAG: hypothetical protein ABS948_04590 [Solibacillus sp.]
MLTKSVLFETAEKILDADYANFQTAVRVKGRSEALVYIDDHYTFLASTHNDQIRLTGNVLALYDGHNVSFYTLEGAQKSQVEVGRFVHDLVVIPRGVLCTYSDEGVFEDGHYLVAAYIDGTRKEWHDVATSNGLTYDILFARHKPYAVLHVDDDKLLFFDEALSRINNRALPFNAGNVLAFCYSYPNWFFIQENELIVLQENDELMRFQTNSSDKVRSCMQKGDVLFLEVNEHQVIGYRQDEGTNVDDENYI